MANWWRWLLYGETSSPAAPATTTDLAEAVAPGTYYDPDANLTAATGGSAYYRRLSSTKRDLTPLHQDRQLEMAFWLYDSNPIAKRALELTRDYVVGDGMQALARGEDSLREKVQAVLDRFWHDPVNDLDMKLPKRVLELGLTGELVLLATVNPRSGHVRLTYVDPSLVDSIAHDPNNPEQPVDVILRASDQVGARKRLRVIRLDEDPNSRAFGRVTGVETDASGNVVTTYRTEGGDERAYDGACFVHRVNIASTATRGRSDLLSIADWLDADDQIGFSDVDRTLLIKSFVWDVTIDGSEADVNNYSKAHATPPKPGSVRYHTSKVTWNAVAPPLNTADTEKTADLVLGKIATGAGLPKTFLNGTVDVNKATATEMSEPTFKHLAERQRMVRACVRAWCRFALDQAELTGALPRRPSQPGDIWPVPWDFEVQVPELRPKDLSTAAELLQEAVSGIVSAKAEGIIDTQTAQEALAILLGQIGVEVDVQAMRERIEAEQAEREAAGLALRQRMAATMTDPDAEDDAAEEEEPAA